jgi:prepilin-type processing-associated H-X9-DG protein
VPLTTPLSQWAGATLDAGYDSPNTSTLNGSSPYYYLGFSGGTTTVVTPINGSAQTVTLSDGSFIYVTNNATTNTYLNSCHPGGINVLLTDGSVRFIPDKMKQTTLAQACVRNDGRVLGSDW